MVKFVYKLGMSDAWYIEYKIEYKGVLPNGALRMLVGNRGDVGLTRSTMNPMLPFYFPVNGSSK